MRRPAGQLRYHDSEQQTERGAVGDASIDLATLSERQLIRFRRDIRMIFQDPFASLNPRMTVFNIIANPLKIHKLAKGKELEDRVAVADAAGRACARNTCAAIRTPSAAGSASGS